MAASLSPDQSNQSNFGGPAAQDKGPLSSMNLGFLKSLTEKRTTRGTELEIGLSPIFLNWVTIGELTPILPPRWEPGQTSRTEARQQAGSNATARAEQTGPEVSRRLPGQARAHRMPRSG